MITKKEVAILIENRKEEMEEYDFKGTPMGESEKAFLIMCQDPDLL